MSRQKHDEKHAGTRVERNMRSATATHMQSKCQASSGVHAPVKGLNMSIEI
jgi:hypothetical protein